MSFPTTHWFVSCPAIITYIFWLCHSLLPNKEDYFVLLVHRGILIHYSMGILSCYLFCLDYGVLPNHSLVCQLLSHYHLHVLAVPLSITKQRRLFCLLVHRDILIHHNVGILSCYLLWHVPSGSNSSFLLLGGMSSQQDISPKRI